MTPDADPIPLDRRPPRRAGWALLVVATALVVFGRTVRFDFVTFDDETHLVDNPRFHPFTARSLAAFWARPYEGLYIPATYTAWGLVAGVATVPGPKGMTLDPAPFHLANVVLHAANAVLVWLILRRIAGGDGPAAVGALLFAVHPLQAEPVAWASGFKDTFTGFWSLLAIALFLCRTRAGYGLATVAFAVALCAKPATVVVPPIAWLLAWAGGRRPDRAGTAVLVGWVAACVPYVWATHRLQADAALMTWNPPAVRPLVAADALAFYSRQLVWPARLAVDYGRTPRWVWDHLGTAAVGIALAGAAMGATLWFARGRPVRAGLAVFVVGLAPVSGAVPFLYQQFSTVSDRYAYLPMLGAGLVAAAAVSKAGRRGARVALVVLFALSARTFVQVGVWHDTVALFEHDLTVNPASALAYNGLGVVAERAGDLPAAAAFDREAARLEPAEPRYPLAAWRVLTRLGGHAAEAQAYRAAFIADAARRLLAAAPDSPLGHRSLGQAYELQGRHADAAAEYARAAQLRASGHGEPALPGMGW